MKIGLLNTSIVTTDGMYHIRTVDVQTAKNYAETWEHDSAIGHEATAEIMSRLLRMKIEVNRQEFKQQPGQHALVFKLKGRPPEGVILTKEEIEEIGYEFKVMYRIE